MKTIKDFNRAVATYRRKGYEAYNRFDRKEHRRGIKRLAHLGIILNNRVAQYHMSRATEDNHLIVCITLWADGKLLIKENSRIFHLLTAMA